jgi:uncharacterized protein (TIGR03437 family)
MKMEAWTLGTLIATVCLAQTVTSNPTTLTQSFAPNSVPATTTLSLAGDGKVALSFTTGSGGNWLSVTPSSGSLPLTATVTIDPSGLPDGTYLGSITAASAAVPVTIFVGDPGPQLPANGIVNAASYQGGAISPGEIITLFGKSIGPKIPYFAQVWDGLMTTKLAGVRVWIDNTPAPVVYAYPDQLAVVVPYAIAGKTSVQVQVENRVARTPSFSVPVQSATPGFFTSDGSGKGQLAALNEDNSLNSAANPASPGSVVVLYATGMGALSPAVGDGTIVSSTPLPQPVLPVQVSIGGKTAQVLYAGAAPGLVAGAIQINASVPTGIASGNARVIATVGTVSSADGCTISVR